MQFLSHERFQPEAAHTFNNDPDYEASQRVLATIVGLVAIGMPAAMLIFGHSDGCVRYSISHHYYTQFLGTVFVGSLFFISAFLIAYRGSTRRENLYATLAGVGAALVAIFPTTGTGCLEGTIEARLFGSTDAVTPTKITEPMRGAFFELFGLSQTIHGLSAAVVFLFLAWYCLVVFTRPVPGVSINAETGKMSTVKQARNAIYYFCGTVIVISILAIVIFGRAAWWNPAKGTLIAETAALWAFGVSWIVKGRLFGVAFNDTDPNLDPSDEATRAP